MDRQDRIGITYAAMLLNKSVTEVKHAVFNDTPIEGEKLPKVIYCGTGNFQFPQDEVIALAERLKKKRSTKR